MNNIVHTRFTSSISELKKNPMEVVNNGFGEAVVILNRNNPAFYCVPADLYERMMDLIEDQELIKLAALVDDEESIEVSLDELQAEIQANRKKKV
ncbi:type II toxin-antitoxin system Phd/YefM family antitoxin [Acinetobacter terrae]|uniref:Antitoxin n=1 Tax=Acinetobacter terrae TaxID=2731247 RepID=A0A4R0EGR7_9GAMM|nr:type II toxin-antitoxin system Phd/YefM family antitoxin [Acinetobacter terrae]TCB55559.1 type II toxin-antitoxin system Phd/YefM family antitoxin [Acinetobacter terrae]